MNFADILRQIEEAIVNDPHRCLTLLGSQYFMNRLFSQELKAFVQMFERVLMKKEAKKESRSEAGKSVRPQVILACYSVAIMRSSTIKVRHENSSTAANRSEKKEEYFYDSKLAIKTLTKMMLELQQSDERKQVIAGLLLKIQGFTSYKFVVNYISPSYVSDEIFSKHYEGFKSQCPQLLSEQLQKHKAIWFKYLQETPLSLEKLIKYVEKFTILEGESQMKESSNTLKQISEQIEYIMNRLKLIEDSSQVKQVGIQQITEQFDALIVKLSAKIIESANFTGKKTQNSDVFPEYNHKQYLHKSYNIILSHTLSLINGFISALGMSWMRKIKWLYKFVLSIFANYSIKNTHFHESIGLEYSKIINLLIQIITNYLITFKSGLFPLGELHGLAVDFQYSIYKMIEAILYNEYPYEEQEIVKYQNYQKQKKNVNHKNQQSIIDIVNFSMKSLNINPHWDNLLNKLVPNIKKSLAFAKKLVNSGLFFFVKYIEITGNHQVAAKLLLMITNAKYSIFTEDKQNKELVKRIKAQIYPERSQAIEGLQYFCEEYFNEFVKASTKRSEQERIQLQRELNQLKSMQISQNNKKSNSISDIIKRTESRDAVIEGWDHFLPATKQQIQTISNNIFEQSFQRNGEVIGNQIFYSIKEDENKAQKKDLQLKDNDMEEENEILIPNF